MVDFRPLLFINALALMLLVTAGFASVHDEIDSGTALTPPTIPQTLAAQAPQSAKPAKTAKAAKPETPLTPQPEAEPETAKAESFQVPPMPEDPTQLAVAEPPATLTTRPDFNPDQPAPAPATGSLVLRSNVVGDQVIINGKDYGATRLDLDLKPGTYDVTITKPGYQAWSRKVALEAGSELTLVGELIAYTTVNFKNGTWIGGVKTGDGTYQNKDGLRYEGHFVNGKFDGEGTAWHPDGSRYDGDWKNGQHHGQGTWRSAEAPVMPESSAPTNLTARAPSPWPTATSSPATGKMAT